MRVFVPDHIKGVQLLGDLHMSISRSHFQNRSHLSVRLTPLEATGCLITILLLFMS